MALHVAAGEWEIEVDADGGVVTLSGDARTYGDMNKAMRAAAKTRGVKSVRNWIALSWESRNPYGYGYDYHPFANRYYPYWY